MLLTYLKIAANNIFLTGLVVFLKTLFQGELSTNVLEVASFSLAILYAQILPFYFGFRVVKVISYMSLILVPLVLFKICHDLRMNFINSVSPFVVFAIKTYIVSLRNSNYKYKSFYKLYSHLEEKNNLRLNDLMQKRGYDLTTPPAQILTVMFIDIVGHSLISQTIRPKKTFNDLRQIFSEIANISEKHGGVIDRILGDGVLIIFGNQITDNPDHAHHARNAVLCAMEIQRKFLHNSLNKPAYGPTYTLRIGINTAFSYVGNVSNFGEADFTVVGDGVVFAKRLQEAAQSLSILIGPSTYDMIKEDFTNEQVIGKKISVKHYDEMIQAYEVLPFFENESSMVAKVISMYRDYLGIMRKDNRIYVPKEVNLRVKFALEQGELLNISQDGFCAKLNGYYGKNLEFAVSFVSNNDKFNEVLKEEKLTPIIAQVRWSSPTSDGHFIHGFSFKLNQEERHMRLFEVFLNEIKKQANIGCAIAALDDEETAEEPEEKKAVVG